MIVEVTLGLVICGILLSLVCFWINFGYFASIETQLLTASQNFQASNEGIADAIVSLGSLLDDLDEVSGDLVRPPQLSDILGQGLQMFMISKFQDMMPGAMPQMINNQQVNPSESWQEAKEANNLVQEGQQV